MAAMETVAGGVEAVEASAALRVKANPRITGNGVVQGTKGRHAASEP